MQGLASPDSLGDVMPSVSAIGARSLVESVIDAFLSGQPNVSLTPEDAPAAVVESVIKERINQALLARDTLTIQLLKEFRKVYQADVAASGQRQFTQGGAAPQAALPETGAGPLPDAIPALAPKG